MPKDTAIDLNLISTEELVDELTERHEEIIIIREDRIHSDWLNIRAKTGFRKNTNRKAKFDVILAVHMLNTAEEQLIKDYLDAGDGGSDSPQDSQEGL